MSFDITVYSAHAISTVGYVSCGWLAEHLRQAFDPSNIPKDPSALSQMSSSQMSSQKSSSAEVKQTGIVKKQSLIDKSAFWNEILPPLGWSTTDVRVLTVAEVDIWIASAEVPAKIILQSFMVLAEELHNKYPELFGYRNFHELFHIIAMGEIVFDALTPDTLDYLMEFRQPVCLFERISKNIEASDTVLDIGTSKK
jgi:hypothetical protein